ncbi:hypothetical protein [Luteitalea sp. TBR-22]|uniref:hypothetical protein n=1 Tax=Luteitalea sp. TBR-22 TaxID=2802971 RepID=UPI001EF45488|nr:hypothetical protein [Luteitalea sp. TBR-22]
MITNIELPADVKADVVVAFGSARQEIDRANEVILVARPSGRQTEVAGVRTWLHRHSCTFECPTGGLDLSSGGVEYSTGLAGCVWHRVGYDLFAEVRHLLTEGQGTEQATWPSLDLHIEALKQILRNNQVTFVEVEPRPSGFPFICCLTHDIDFAGMRRHGVDRTMAGFLSRASLGTLRDLVNGRRTWSEALKNLGGVLSWPLVLLGLKSDPWRPFDDYSLADASRSSTFFVVPTRNHAGVSPRGDVEPTRAVRYQADDVRDELAAAAAEGREIALHGLDAWRDTTDAVRECARVGAASGRPVSGVRMHWLYFDQGSARRLDEAGFDYDSTSGYNEAVGYRAGTSQAFMPPGCTHLLEIPLHIMDTALFFPDRLGLSTAEGIARCEPIIMHARNAGGAIIVNWHDRSLVVERQWGRAYDALLAQLDAHAPWYATVRDAVEWFRWRRAIAFSRTSDGKVAVQALAARPGLPGALFKVDRGSAGHTESHVLAPASALVVQL